MSTVRHAKISCARIEREGGSETLRIFYSSHSLFRFVLFCFVLSEKLGHYLHKKQKYDIGDRGGTDNKDLTSAPSKQLSLLSAMPRDVMFAVLEYANLGDYDSLWMVNAHHRQLVATYLGRYGCKLRDNNNTGGNSRILSMLRRVNAAVGVLQLPRIDLTSEIEYHIQRIISCSRNSLTAIELTNMELLRVYPFLMGCSKLRVCHGLSLQRDCWGYQKQFRSFLQSSNAIRSMTLSLENAANDAKTVAELVATGLTRLESLDLTLQPDQLDEAWPHLTNLSSALTSLKLHLANGRPSEHSCKKFGFDLEAFTMLNSLTFDGAFVGTHYPYVMWALPPTVAHCVNYVCTSVFDAKQIQSWFGSVYNDMALFFGITMPNMAELSLEWRGEAHQPITAEALLANFYAPCLTKFTALRYVPPPVLSMALHMPALRFLNLEMCVILSIEDVLCVLESVPLIERVCVSASKKFPLCSSFLIPSSSSSLLSRVHQDEKKKRNCHATVDVPHLRQMQLEVHADSLVDALLAISSPRLVELQIECIITEPGDTVAILNHYSWLKPFHGIGHSSCFFCQSFTDAALGYYHYTRLLLCKEGGANIWPCFSVFFAEVCT